MYVFVNTCYRQTHTHTHTHTLTHTLTHTHTHTQPKYRIAQNVGGEKLWRNHSTHAFGRENFGKFSKYSITF